MSLVRTYIFDILPLYFMFVQPEKAFAPTYPNIFRLQIWRLPLLNVTLKMFCSDILFFLFLFGSSSDILLVGLIFPETSAGFSNQGLSELSYLLGSDRSDR